MPNYAEKFSEICKTCHKIFLERNKLYGNAFILTGVLGATAELIGDISRLRRLVLRSPAVLGARHFRLLQDTFIDIHNYATFALMMLEEDNWRGRDPTKEEIENVQHDKAIP